MLEQKLSTLQELVQNTQESSEGGWQVRTGFSPFLLKRHYQDNFYVPPTEGGGHIVFGAVPVGVGVRVRVASFLRDIF